MKEQDHECSQAASHGVHEDVGDGVNEGDEHLNVDGGPTKEGKAGHGLGWRAQSRSAVEEAHSRPHEVPNTNQMYEDIERLAVVGTIKHKLFLQVKEPSLACHPL